MALFLALTLTLVLAPAHADSGPLTSLPTQFVVESWRAKTGLPEETIHAVTQTPDGYLWLATTNGLVRYDGDSFQIYQPSKDLGGAVKQEISRMGLGGRNSVWIYSVAYGLVLFEKGIFRLAPKYPRPCRVNQIIDDGEGTLVVCRERVLRIVGDRVDEVKGIREEFPSEVLSATRDPTGNLWVGSADGRLAQLNANGAVVARFGVKEGVPKGGIQQILAVGPNRVWLATDGGLGLLDKGTIKLFTQRDGLSSPLIRRLLLGRDGSLWVGTALGMNLYRNGRFENFLGVPELPADVTLSIFEDHEENVWISSGPTNLFRLRKPKFLSWGTREGMFGYPTAILPLKDAVWFAQKSDLQLLRGGDLTRVPLRAGTSPLISLEEDANGQVWALTNDAVFVVEPASHKVNLPRLPPGIRKMRTLNRDHQGRIWIVADSGLYVADNLEIRQVSVTGWPAMHNRVDLRQSRNGRLWLAVDKAGLFEIRDGKAIRMQLDADPELDGLYTFYIDAHDDFWLGMDGGGLARWRNGKLARYGNQKGEVTNFIYQFGEDLDGQFWLGTRSGLIRIQKAELNDYLDGKTTKEPQQYLYDIGDGLRSFNFGLAERTVPSLEPASVLWFGNLLGALRIDTRHIPVNKLAPPIHLLEIAADDIQLPLGDKVTVPAGSGVLRIAFSVPSLVDPSKVRARYRLEPLDSKWRNTAARSVTFSQVPPGKYTLSLQASNNDRIWNQEGLSVSILVLPQFFQAWWFRILMACVVAMGMISVYLWRTLALRREKAELERRVDERTAELAQAKQIAENASHVKSEFLATMSHEIRTPMHGVLGTLELLSDTPMNVQQMEYLDTVRNSSNSLLTVLNDVLDLSKIEAGRMELRIAPFSLRQTADDVTRLLRAAASAKSVDLRVSSEQNLPEYFQGDEVRIRQILFNLASNAVKFTQVGGVSIEISGKRREGDTWDLRIAVSDTGIGIPHDRLADLFQEFFQVDSSNSRRYGGTGLGLAISKRLADFMNASIIVESEVGRGSTFCFAVSLPRAEAVPVARPARLAVITKRFARNILVAEDNKVNQRLAQALLERLGCTVTIVGDGKQAVAAAERFPFSLIFMDCQMPEMDGFEATRIIRSKPGNKPVIIAMTANALPGDRERCLEAGMNDYLAKPFQQSDLIRLLDLYVPDVQPDHDPLLFTSSTS